MRTETRTYEVYQLHELSKEAQAKAHNHWMEHFDYGWENENRQTLQSFEALFNIKVERWSYDSYTYQYRFISHHSYEEDNLRGIRLLKYLINNYWHELFIPKTSWSKGCKKKRKSRVFVTNECVLTGYCMDDSLLKPIYNFLKAPYNISLYELLDRCLDCFFKACREDIEYLLSEEAFAESCEANNYEFLSNGTSFN